MTTLIPKFDLKDGGSTPAGAVNRPINEKLQEIVSVKDFGAVGNGVADDSAAIQAALDTGGQVYFPIGTYLCNVTATKGTFIQGAGNGVTILKPFNTANPVLTIDNFPQPSYYYEYVNDIGFVGPIFGSVINQVLTGVGIQLGTASVGRIVFNRISVTGFQKGFYKPNGNLGNTFYDCNFSGNSYGYYVANSAMQPGNDRFEGGNFSENTFCGVYVISNAAGIGGFVFNETIFQQNYGFGVYINIVDSLGDARYPAIIFNNTYEEQNGQFKNGWGGTQVTLTTLTGTLTANPIPYRVDGTTRIVSIGGYGSQLLMGSVPTIQPTSTPIISSTNIQVTDTAFFGTGSSVASVRGDGSGNLIIGKGTGGAIIPSTATVNLGTAVDNRWNAIFVNYITALATYSETTADEANLVIENTGCFKRSTSSIQYKKDVEVLQNEYADKLLEMQPIWYRSNCKGDNADWSFYGLIAEDVAKIDPRYVSWGYPIKEIVLASGDLVKVPDTDKPLQPEGVQYERLVVGLLNLVQRQQKSIDDLNIKIDALKV